MLDVLRVTERAKDVLSEELGLTHAMLHLHVGLGLFVVFSLLLRRPAGSVLPLLLVGVLEGVNELMDFARYQLSDWPWKPGPTIHDLVDTLLWPAVLTLLGRLHRWRDDAPVVGHDLAAQGAYQP